MIRLTAIALSALLLVSFFSILESDAFGVSSSSSKRQNSINLDEGEISKIQVNKYSNYVHFQPEWNYY